MRWKDFLHYQQGEKIAVIILLTLILAALVLIALVSHRKSNQIVLAHNESLILEFEKFIQELKEKENIETESRPTAGNINSKNRVGNSSASSYQTESPSKSSFTPAEKLNPGETILLNETDTAQWKKIPGIGSTFAARIVKYGKSMGGYVNKEQLKEVYGIDNELFIRISAFIDEDQNFSRLLINRLEFQSLLSHPYLNYKQVQAILNLRKKKGKIDSIRELGILDEFTSDDIARLQPYLDFQ